MEGPTQTPDDVYHTIGGAITTAIAEKGTIPERWDYIVPTKEDPRFLLTIMWPSKAVVRYVIDPANSVEETAQLIYDGENETEWIRRPQEPIKVKKKQSARRFTRARKKKKRRKRRKN